MLAAGTVASSLAPAGEALCRLLATLMDPVQSAKRKRYVYDFVRGLEVGEGEGISFICLDIYRQETHSVLDHRRDETATGSEDAGSASASNNAGVSSSGWSLVEDFAAKLTRRTPLAALLCAAVIIYNKSQVRSNAPPLPPLHRAVQFYLILLAPALPIVTSYLTVFADRGRPSCQYFSPWRLLHGFLRHCCESRVKRLERCSQLLDRCPFHAAVSSSFSSSSFSYYFFYFYRIAVLNNETNIAATMLIGRP